MQTLRAGCSKVEPKIFSPPQTPFLGVQDGQNTFYDIQPGKSGSIFSTPEPARGGQANGQTQTVHQYHALLTCNKNLISGRGIELNRTQLTGNKNREQHIPATQGVGLALVTTPCDIRPLPIPAV